MSKKIFLAFIITALSLLVLGLVFAGGYVVGKKSLEQKFEQETGVLQSKLEKFYPAVPKEIKRISGEVLKIENNAIDLKTKIRTRRFPEAGKDVYDEMIKKAILTDKTTIYKIDRQGKVVPGEGLPKTSLKLEDIKRGDWIAVQSDKDVKSLDSFEAKSIEWLFQRISMEN